jgi:hypothetical protein
VVKADGHPGSIGGEDRFRGLVDRVVEDVEDGPVALDGMVEGYGEHRRWAGAGQLGVGPEVLTHPFHCTLLGVDSEHEPVAKHQLDLPELDGFLSDHPPDRLDLRKHQVAGNFQDGPFARCVCVIDQRTRHAELVAVSRGRRNTSLIRCGGVLLWGMAITNG